MDDPQNIRFKGSQKPNGSGSSSESWPRADFDLVASDTLYKCTLKLNLLAYGSCVPASMKSMATLRMRDPPFDNDHCKHIKHHE